MAFLFRFLFKPTQDTLKKQTMLFCYPPGFVSWNLRLEKRGAWKAGLREGSHRGDASKSGLPTLGVRDVSVGMGYVKAMAVAYRLASIRCGELGNQSSLAACGCAHWCPLDRLVCLEIDGFCCFRLFCAIPFVRETHLFLQARHRWLCKTWPWACFLWRISQVKPQLWGWPVASHMSSCLRGRTLRMP